MLKKAVILTMTLLLAMSASVLAEGNKESAGTAGTTATSMEGVVVPGELAIYSSPADFSRETGSELPAYGESPDLAALVAAGDLPPVEDRLPAEPVVIDPKVEIGTYGGDFRTSAITPTTAAADAMFDRLQNLLTLTPDRTAVIPNIVKGWEVSSDKKATTIYLREGLKWSDGVPLTADDFLFWYEDFLLNKELTPRPNVAWRPGGEVMKVTKVDDYTVTYEFAVPYPAVVEKFGFSPYSRNANTFPVLPKHHLEQFHIKYNKDAEADAKEAGFDSWWQMFNDHVQGDEQGRRDTEFPALGPWVFNRVDTYGNRYYERNPYYWKVDTQGQQLPYVDRQVSINCGSMDVVNIKALAGEFSYATFSLTLDNYTLYKESEQAGDYQTMLWGMPRNEMAYGFNLTYGDPVLREIFNDIRFREAMSVAINRQEINEVIAFGRAIPRQATGPLRPDGLFTEDWMGDYYVEYDVNMANERLDDMNLKWDSDHKYRLRPDGETFEIVIDYMRTEGAKQKIHQMVARNWEDVGVKVVLKEASPSLHNERYAANEVMIYTAHFDNRGPYGMVWREAPHFKTGWGRLHEDWFNSGGTAGLEPPADIQAIYGLIGEYVQHPVGSEESNRIGGEILTRHVKGLYRIGTVDYIPQPVIAKNALMTNFTEVDMWGPTGLWHNNTLPEQWFWKE
jgi:peptide/nickel transport system substrate-binding protein